jgi:hypothetical protein
VLFVVQMDCHHGDLSSLRQSHFPRQRIGLASIKWKDGVSVSGPFFELDWAEVIQRYVSPDWIVEAIDISGNGIVRIGAYVELGAPDHFDFDRLKEGFNHRIIITISFARH